MRVAPVKVTLAKVTPMRVTQAKAGPLLALAFLVAPALACGQGSESGTVEGVETASTAAVRPENPDLWPASEDSIAGTPWTRTDWAVFIEVLETAEARGFRELPIGEAIGAMGRLFIGTPYVAQTLEVPGPERLVVNLRALDCVTFVESVLALTRVHRGFGVGILEDPAAARAAYEAALTELRYRDGANEGYGSRLHYFTEWMSQGYASDRLAEVAPTLGGAIDHEPIDFMSRHADAYRQLGDPDVLAQVAQVETRLNRDPSRSFIPQDRIAEVASGIRTGDVIAATSAVGGLDVAHTGIAVWENGDLHLLHAPLVGSTVVLSERPLAQRIAETRSQDGILVGRPQAAWFTAAGPGSAFPSGGGEG